VRKLVAPLYANGGRPSVDPVVFFKLQLVMFFEDLRSERQLMRAVADRLSVRWYLGYDLFEPLPDRSSLTRIRERFGLSIFRRFFERIVQECFEAGLVWGEELFFDATKVEANASIDSTRSRSLVEGRLEEHLAATFPGDALPAPEEVRSGTIADVVGPVGEEGRELTRKNADRHRWIAGAGRQERALARWGYKRMADLMVSTTDPDASPKHQKKRSTSRLGYLTHYVVDGGKARVVLNVLLTGAEVTENLPMQEMLFWSTFRWRLRPRSATGDAAYGTRENIAAVEKASIRSSAPVVPGVEKAEDWEEHRDGMLESLQPEGHLETVLAERVALLSWRLHRVVRYETESIALYQERVEDDLAKERRFESGPDHPDAVSANAKSAREEHRLFKRFAKMEDEKVLSSFGADLVIWGAMECADNVAEGVVDPEELLKSISVSGLPDSDSWEG
jgi:transposase